MFSVLKNLIVNIRNAIISQSHFSIPGIIIKRPNKLRVHIDQLQYSPKDIVRHPAQLSNSKRLILDRRPIGDNFRQSF